MAEKQNNTKARPSPKQTVPKTVYKMNKHEIVVSKTKNGLHRLTVTDPTGAKKMMLMKDTPGKLFDWEPIIDGASLIGDMIAPELSPFIEIGKRALKHHLKKEHKEKHHHKHESKFEEAITGHEVKRSLTPFENTKVHPRVKAILGPYGQFTQGHPRGAITQAHDGKVVAIEDYRKWYESRTHGARMGPFANVVLQDNLRKVINAKWQKPKTVTLGDRTVENFARLNRKSSLSDSNVPVLQGDTGMSMDMAPVTIAKTDTHAVMGGSELLTDLIVPTGAGAAGNDIIDWFLNPRTFQGTRLAIESQNWLQFKFRKFIVEYCPIIGSGQAGAFIGWYTQDPDEIMSNGLNQRRNAAEHVHSVPFQPFSYTVVAMTPKPHDEILYYLTNQNDGNDDRLVYQGRLLFTNNAQNADASTVTSYGIINIHYEVDFFFPAIGSAASSANAPPQTVTTATTAIITSGTAVYTYIASGSWWDTNVAVGSVYEFTMGNLPTNGSICYFNRAGLPSPIVGQRYFATCVSTGANIGFIMFDQLQYASAPINSGNPPGALFGSSPTVASAASWVFQMPSKVTPTILAEIRNLTSVAYTPEPESDSDEVDKLSQSELALINIKRRVAQKFDALPADQLPSIQAQRKQTVSK